MKFDSGFLSRDTFVSATVLSFAVLVILITIGMLTPLLVKLASGMEIGMDTAYFNLRTAPFTFVLVFLLCLCLFASQRSGISIIIVAGGVILLSVIFILLSPAGDWKLDAFIPPVIAAIASVISRIFQVLRTRSGTALLRGMGAHVIHLGILLIIIGVVASSTMKTEDSAVYVEGIPGSFDSMEYTIEVTGMSSDYEGTSYGYYPGSSYVTSIGFDIYKNGAYFDSGTLEYITDIKWRQTYTSTYINRGLSEELFIAPRALDENNGEVDLYVRVVPFITLVWVGIWLMFFGMSFLIIPSFLRQRSSMEVEE